MRHAVKPIYLLALLAAFLFCGPSWGAEGGKDVFKINGKDVPPIVAIVNGTHFSSDFLRNELMAVQSLAEQQGQKITPEDEENYARGILITAIEKELIFQKGKGLNIQVDPKTIQRQINHIRKQFPSKKMFLTALAYQHMTLRDLEKKIEKELVEDEFVRREISSKIHVEDKAVIDFYNKNKSAFIEPDEYEVSHIFTEIIQQG
ncbi:MAG: SurA N-terminal domain-containing protein, partial [Nitrospinales bacterium]